jgi:hypothetical protein
MDNAFDQFMNWHTLLLALGCYILTFITRRGLETWKPSLRPVKHNRTESYKNKFAKWWNSFILYLLPPVWGVLVALVLFKHLPWPVGITTVQGAMFFGMVCGWCSGLVYKLFKKTLIARAGVATEGALPRDKDPKVPGEDKTKREVEEKD